jgi:site-specific DNA-methyltransferase (adenine-specific)
MATLPDASVDAVVCDPPYELGFMGKSWDASGIAYDVEVWRQAFRVLKPGGHVLAFSGSRTYHWMTCAIEDAGFDIRDQIMWVYGSGFPKSLDVSKAIDRAAGAEREVVGLDEAWIKRTGMSAGEGTATFTTSAFGSASGPNAGRITAPATDAARQWSGWGTALKPAHEPICMARKPLIGTVAANVLAHGTGAINVDGCRVGTKDALVRPPIERTNNSVLGVGLGVGTQTEPLGRWPANFIHDGSEEATPGLGEAARFFYCAKASRSDREDGCDNLPARTGAEALEREEGSAGMDLPRAGAGRTASTVKNHHPTVKPTELMRYLCRLVTPPGGTILDPFMGSGSTGRGAVLEGFSFIGIEMNEDYLAIAQARINAVIPPLLRGAP